MTHGELQVIIRGLRLLHEHGPTEASDENWLIHIVDLYLRDGDEEKLMEIESFLEDIGT